MVNAGNEFRSTAEVLATGSSQQASASEEVSATMEELSASIEQNSMNAENSFTQLLDTCR